MAFLFGDSFHHLSQADLTKKWANSPANSSIGTSDARFPGSKYLAMASTAASLQAFNLGNKSTLIVGFAFWVSGTFGNDLNMCSLRDNGNEQLSLRLTSGGLFLYVSRNGTTLATATTALNGGAWYYIEFKATIHNTAGAYAVRVNGAPIAGISDATNVNTRGSTTNNYANQVWFHDGSVHGAGNSFRYGDVYILDDTGPAPLNNFLGDVRYDVLYPDGAGAYSQWTPTSGANYTTVDESPANQTDYVESTADDQIDSYSFADMSVAASTIYVVQVNAYAQKTDAGNKSLAIFCKASDGTESVSADQALGSSWLVYRRILPEEPYSGGTRPWTVARVNGSQFGVKSRP
jgi:hypothetical protein